MNPSIYPKSSNGPKSTSAWTSTGKASPRRLLKRSIAGRCSKGQAVIHTLSWRPLLIPETPIEESDAFQHWKRHQKTQSYSWSDQRQTSDSFSKAGGILVIQVRLRAPVHPHP